MEDSEILADCSTCARQDPETGEWVFEKTWQFQGVTGSPTEMFGFYYRHEPVSDQCSLPGHIQQSPPCVTKCQCTGCWEYETHLHHPDRIPLRNFANRHCFTCICRDCVCDCRRHNQQFSTQVCLPHWDSNCLGSCWLCQDTLTQ